MNSIKVTKDNPGKKNESKISIERRNALIKGTIQSLAELGIAGTTVSTICTYSNSSRGLIAHHFGSKEVLLAEALKHLYGTVSQSVQKQIANPDLSPHQRLYTFPEALFSKSVFTQKNRSAFLCLWHETRFNDIVRRANQELYRGYVKRMETLFFEAISDNDDANNLLADGVKAAAIGFIGLSDGLWLGMSIHNKLIERTSAINTCHRFIDHELADLRSKQ